SRRNAGYPGIRRRAGSGPHFSRWRRSINLCAAGSHALPQGEASAAEKRAVEQQSRSRFRHHLHSFLNVITGSAIKSAIASPKKGNTRSVSKYPVKGISVAIMTRILDRAINIMGTKPRNLVKTSKTNR